MTVLTDHICKKMNELNLIRCKKIPKTPGADWRDLPDEHVSLTLIHSGRKFLLNLHIILNAIFL